MDVNEMLWTPHGSLSIGWEHGEPYHEAYGGIVPYEDLLGLCIEYRSWERRAEKSRAVGRYIPDPKHRVSLGKGDRVAVVNCTPESLAKWESPAYIIGCAEEDWYLYDAEDTQIVVEGPKTGRRKTVKLLGDLLDDAVEVMREACRQ